MSAKLHALAAAQRGDREARALCWRIARSLLAKGCPLPFDLARFAAPALAALLRGEDPEAALGLRRGRGRPPLTRMERGDRAIALYLRIFEAQEKLRAEGRRDTLDEALGRLAELERLENPERSGLDSREARRTLAQKPRSRRTPPA